MDICANINMLYICAGICNIYADIVGNNMNDAVSKRLYLSILSVSTVPVVEHTRTADCLTADRALL